MTGPRDLTELKIQDSLPSTLTNINGGPPGGARAEDLGAPTINAKKPQRRGPRGVRADDPGAPTINAKKRRR
jgi:hypothetical protein